LAAAQADYYHKLSPRRLLAASAQFRYGSRLDPEVQLTLGADTGLRGYPVRQFTGNRSLLLAGEHRWFIADEVARLLSIGLAGFVDAGFVWPEGESLALGDMRTDLGISLLIGRNRFSSRRGLRLDLAYALQPVPGRSRWLFSAGSRIGF
jgi:hemolysin activation/secretion protein